VNHARGIARALAFVAWTLSVGLVWLAVRAFLRGARRARGGALALSLWSRGLCGLLGIRVTAWDRGEGAPARGSNIPRTPHLLVSNHIGYLDVIVLSALAGARDSAHAPALFVSKDDLARWPVMGPLGRSVGTLFLDRDRPRAVAEVAAGMRAAFAGGQSVIVFPEGTTTGGDVVRPFHTALFEPALRASVPVRGAFLAYMPRSRRDPADLAAWTGDASFVPHLYRLFRSGGLEARVTLQPQPTLGGDRRRVAEEIRGWMQQRLEERERAKAPGPEKHPAPGNPAQGPRRPHFRRTAARFSPPRSGDRIFN